jgi:hypothetical protein
MLSLPITVLVSVLPWYHKVHKLLLFVYSKTPAVRCPGCDTIQALLFEVTQDGMELGWKQCGTVNALPDTAIKSANVALFVFICRIAVIDHTQTPH